MDDLTKRPPNDTSRDPDEGNWPQAAEPDIDLELATQQERAEARRLDAAERANERALATDRDTPYTTPLPTLGDQERAVKPSYRLGERPRPEIAAKPRLPEAPWEHLYDGVDRLKVPGGYLYRADGQLCFVAGA